MTDCVHQIRVELSRGYIRIESVKRKENKLEKMFKENKQKTCNYLLMSTNMVACFIVLITPSGNIPVSKQSTAVKVGFIESGTPTVKRLKTNKMSGVVGGFKVA